jgi:hypothetical protein
MRGIHEAYWCALNLSISSKPQVGLSRETQSPSPLRWRLRGQVSHIRHFEITVKSATPIGLMDSRRCRDWSHILNGYAQQDL